VKRGSFAETIEKRARRQLRRVEAILEAGKMDDPEAVHDLRVALRRLRSLWKIASDEDDKRAKKLRRDARDLAQSLGAVRETDVLIERIAGDQAEGRLPKASATKWMLRLTKERQTALANALKQIHGDQAARWLRAAQKWANQQGEGPGLTSNLEQMVRKHAEAVLDNGNPVTDGELHELRIVSKRLRYLIEFFEKDLAAPEPMIEALVKVQDVLGECRDRRFASDLARAEGLVGYATWLLEHAEEGVAEAVEAARAAAHHLLGNSELLARDRKRKRPI